MKRTQIQLDDATYDTLRTKAYEQGVSMASLVRKAVEAYLSEGKTDRRPAGFRFVGSGRSKQGDLKPVSEQHDEALEEAFAQ